MTPRSQSKPTARNELDHVSSRKFDGRNGEQSPAAGRADALARTLGIDEVLAELQPEEKAEIVKRMRRDGRKVAFLGDGINDAPALSTADVGIAMPLGAEIARATADVVLVKDHLASVADAHKAALNAMALIRSNFRAAIGINTALFLAASMGWLSPVAAAVLHNGTTLALLGRALSAESFPKRARNPAIPLRSPLR